MSTENTTTLKSLRESQGMAQSDLAEKSNTHWRSIAEWERGRIPKFDNAIALAKALRVPLKTLARSLRLDVSDVPDDIDSLMSQAIVQQKSLKQLLREKGYDVSEIPNEGDNEPKAKPRKELSQMMVLARDFASLVQKLTEEEGQQQ